MKRPVKEAALRERLIGLGENSSRKTYYPELKKRINDLEAAKEKVEQAYKAKNDFYLNMYHELKTPAHGIVTLSKLLQDTLIDKETKQIVQDIYSSAKRLNLLIGELFDATKEGFDESDNISRTDLNSLVENVISPITSRVSAISGQTIELTPDWKLEHKFLGKIKLIEIAIEQFLKMITKYSKDRDEYTLSIKKGHETQTTFELVFEIILDDVKLNEQRQKRFFSVIKKAYENTINAPTEPIVTSGKLEAFHGRFELAETASGTIFKYIALVEKSLDETIPRSMNNEVADDSQLSKIPKILVAEDNEINIRVIELMLEEVDCELVIAMDGKKAVELTEAYDLSLILMDIRMPIMGGEEAISIIRQREKATGTRIPIVALTAYAADGDRERILKAGADEYLTKPVDIEHFEETIERFLPSAIMK